MLHIQDEEIGPPAGAAVAVGHNVQVAETWCQSHGADEIVTVASGFGFLYGAEQALFLQPGDVWVKSPGQRYRLVAFKNLSLSRVQISRDGRFLFIRDIASLLERLYQATGNTIIPGLAPGSNIQTAQLLIEEFLQADNEIAGIARQAQQEIALLKLIIFIQQASVQPQYCREHRLLDFIFQHCTEKLNWDVLCASVNLSRRTFCRYTDRHLAMTPEKIHIIFKLIKAQEWLRTSDEPIGDIAIRCGFSTPSQLSSAYRKAFSITPSQERESLFPCLLSPSA